MSPLLTGQDISLDIGFGTIPILVYAALGITSFIIAAATVSQITNEISNSTEYEPVSEPAAEVREERSEIEPESREKLGGKKKKTKSKKPRVNNKRTRGRNASNRK